jgi:hypothetical protein
MRTHDDIKPGDLVAVVRGHQCVINAVGGIPFEVDCVHRVTITGVSFICVRCGHAEAAGGVRFVLDRRGNTLPLPWLKKFPPLEVPEVFERDEKVRD